MYSQNNEEQILLNHFGSRGGSLLSIGENDGISFSNARQLILNGWGATLVEPSARAFTRLRKLYDPAEKYPDITLVNKAIGLENGTFLFYDMGEHAIKGSTSLLSTLKPQEMDRWADVLFEETEVDVIDVHTLLRDYCPLPMFDLVMIDCEGCDYDVLSQFKFDLIYTSCVVVEWNNKDAEKYDAFMFAQEFKLIHVNAENRIYAFVR